MVESKSKVANFISRHVSKSGKTAVEIAQEAGYDKPNIISMLKAGVTKLPLDRVPRLAAALEIEPITLMRLCMEEYMPETLKIFDDLKIFTGYTANEEKIIREIRKLSGNSDPRLHAGNAQYLKEFVTH